MIRDYSYECDDRASWEAFAKEIGILDAEGRPTPGMHVDWIGKIEDKEYVNVRYVESRNVPVAQRVSLLTSFSSPSVRWTDPATIEHYPRIWAGGMTPLTDEMAGGIHETLYLEPLVERSDDLKEKLKKEIAWTAEEDWTNNPIMKGDRRTYDDALWESLVDYNVWAPPIGWREVVTEGYPQWRQPTGAHDAYQRGDRVSHIGKNYESTIDANVWAPDVYPAGWMEIE